MKKIFIQWLKDNNLFAQYKHNWINHNFDEDYMDMKAKNYWLYIETSFDWEATPEGYDFWEDISDQWHNIICRIGEEE